MDMYARAGLSILIQQCLSLPQWQATLPQTQNPNCHALLAATDAKFTPTALTFEEAPHPYYEKPWYDYGGGHKYEALALVQFNKPTISIPTATTMHHAGLAPPSPYLTKKGNPAKGLTVDEAKHMVDWLLREVYTQHRRKPMLLIVDRHPSHKSPDFIQHCASRNVVVKLLPPRSYDLCPLDSHFFAVVKDGVRQRVCTEHIRNWPAIVDLLEEKMHSTPAANHIRNYLLKLRACLNANGHRFDHEYTVLKAELAQRVGAKTHHACASGSK
jgi:hypothetical protein